MVQNELSFYHLTLSTLESALPKLLEKIYNSKKPALVFSEDLEKLKKFDHLLWTYSSKTFIPHATCFDPFPEHQPVLFSNKISIHDYNKVLVILDDKLPEAWIHFEKILYMFDGENEKELSQAKSILEDLNKNHKNTNINYWQQNHKLGWVNNNSKID